MLDPNILVVPQDSAQFHQAVDFYEKRLDKEWGVVDCSSFLIMQERRITEALAHDQHFAQAGFKALLRED